MKTITTDILSYNQSQSQEDKAICEILKRVIDEVLPQAECKIWHGHPVYSKLKERVRLMFWSGQSFEEPGLQKEGSFKAAEVRYTHRDEINLNDLQRWLKKAADIQWDYKNIVKRKGSLERLK